MNRFVKLTISNLLDVAKAITKKTGVVALLLTSTMLFPRVSFSETGEKIFKDLCAACHTTTDQTLMGPGLKGITDKKSEEWLIKWVKNSQELIDTKDKDAVEIFEKFNKIPMPPFAQLSDDDIKGVLSYANDSQSATSADASAQTAAPATSENGGNGTNSTLIFFVTTFIVLFGAWIINYRRKASKLFGEFGHHPEPHKTPNYFFYFFLYMLIAAGLVYFLIDALAQKTGMIGTLMFIVLPYLSFGIFLIGSIYRYKQRGFQVSSLSSQFLEGKKLFWGSLPFHWGILFLFFGHLIAFLFPRSVLAWNGNPVRLLILELSSFAFGLAVLFGLILLIKRRLSEKKLLVVANKMDMVVYTVLFTQVLSGLGVAFFVRWGSSWFSSVLTPYLRSIFSFSPDINAMVEMPWLIQIHVISAFLIIGIIPFTRFVHFLVAPIDYAWRKYQIVIWNWNPKNIRVSRRYNFGKKPRNH